MKIKIHLQICSTANAFQINKDAIANIQEQFETDEPILISYRKNSSKLREICSKCILSNKECFQPHVYDITYCN